MIKLRNKLILRYFIAKNGKTKFEDYRVSYTHLSEFIDKETIKLIEDQSFNIDSEISLFKKVFDLLNGTLGSDSFKKYNRYYLVMFYNSFKFYWCIFFRYYIVSP